MYQVGDLIMYGVHGVCCVVDFEERVIDRKKAVYMVLEPTGQQGSARYYVPTHNTVAMSKLRKMLTQEEMASLLQSDLVRKNIWIQDENQRKQTYRELIGSGDRVNLMQMVHTLYQHKDKQYAAGKKVHQCDENFLKDAEKLLCSEISAVLEMGMPEALTHLRTNLKA